MAGRPSLIITGYRPYDGLLKVLKHLVPEKFSIVNEQ
jgi:hypothetical protein